MAGLLQLREAGRRHGRRPVPALTALLLIWATHAQSLSFAEGPPDPRPDRPAVDLRRVLIDPLLFGELSVFAIPREPLAEPDDPHTPPTPALLAGKHEPRVPVRGTPKLPDRTVTAPQPITSLALTTGPPGPTDTPPPGDPVSETPVADPPAARPAPLPEQTLPGPTLPDLKPDRCLDPARIVRDATPTRLTRDPAASVPPARRRPIPAPLTDAASPVRLHPSFVRDRRVEQKLRSALRDLNAAELESALQSLQLLLEAEEDSFAQTDAAAHGVSVRWETLRLLSDLPRAGRDLYETLYGGVARSELARLEASRTSGDHRTAGLREIARRYFHTHAGRMAIQRLADEALEEGDFTAAAGLWRRILSDERHTAALTGVQRAKAAFVLHQAGDPELARRLMDSLAERPVVLAGETLSGRDWYARFAPTATADASRIQLVGYRPELPNFSGHTPWSEHRTRVTGTPPVRNRVLWEQRLSGEQSRHVDPLIHAWLGYQRTNGLPAATANTPLVSGDCVIVRDFDGLRCVSLRDGTIRWRYTASSSLARDIPVQLAVPIEGNPDPANLKRMWVGNALMGTLSGDGERVYAVEGVEQRWNQGSVVNADGQDPATLARRSNQLIALAIGSDSPDARPLWTLGGPVPVAPPPPPAAAPAPVPTPVPVPAPGLVGANVAPIPAGVELVAAPAPAPVAPAPVPAPSTLPERDTLAGCFFLGVPTAVEGTLYALVEFDQQLQIVAIEPRTGSVRWRKAVGLVATPVHLDQQRYTLHASPVVARGVVLFPTHNGVLLALDAASGTLMWGHAYDDPEQLQLLGAWPNNTRLMHGHAAFPNQPVVAGSRIVYLSPHDDEIRCLDLHTGQPLWTSRRRDLDQSQAIEHVAAIDQGVVFVSGRLKCRGLDLETGDEVWSRPLAHSPCGRGVALGGTYVLPLSNGATLPLEIRTGRPVGFAMPHDDWHAGTLAAGGDVIVSLTPGSLRAWSQAHAAGDRSVDPLAGAEVHLALGSHFAAKDVLRGFLADQPGHAHASQARETLREVLFAELDGEAGPRRAILDELNGIAVGPEQRGRFLVHQALHARESGDAAGLFGTIEELLTLSGREPLVPRQDPSRVVAPDAWVRGLLSRPTDATDAHDVESELAARVLADLRRAINAGDERRLRHLSLLHVYPQASRLAGLALARSLAARGRSQEAEVRFLACRQSDDAGIAALATRDLATLWDERGLHHEAALLWDELATKYADVEVARGFTGLSYVQHAAEDSLTAQAWRRLQPKFAAGAKPRIREERWLNSPLQSTYNGSGIQFLPTPRSSTFDLFDKGRGSGGMLALVNRQTGQEYPEAIRIPMRYFYPVSTTNSFVGHLLPLGSLGAVHGVSLLDREVAWTTSPPGLASRSETVRVGPAGPGFATFQCRQQLFVLDPANGELLWQRTDLESLTGLMADTSCGLFGDQRVLVVFAADRSHYTLYETATGAELCRGRIDADRRQLRRAYGRFLAYLTNKPTDRRLRIWDPLHDHLLLDVPADSLADISLKAGVAPGTKAYQFVRGAEELAYITADQRLRIVDVRSGESRLELPLPTGPDAQLGHLRVCADNDRYYINVHELTEQTESPQTTFVTSDTTLPAEHFQGTLHVVDRHSGRPLWTRAVGNRSLLHVPEFRLPYLVTLCRVRRGNQLSGEVAIHDAATGEQLALHDGLLPDRLLQYQYNRDAATLELRGARTEIRIDFDGGRGARWSEDTAAVSGQK